MLRAIYKNIIVFIIATFFGLVAYGLIKLMIFISNYYNLPF